MNYFTHRPFTGEAPKHGNVFTATTITWYSLTQIGGTIPITQLFTFPNLLVVNNDVPARSVQ